MFNKIVNKIYGVAMTLAGVYAIFGTTPKEGLEFLHFVAAIGLIAGGIYFCLKKN